MTSGRCDCESVLRERILSLGVFAALLKLLLFPVQFSTDMDVHAHWKALMHHVPLAQWYTDTSSQWTLDYPPLFAYVEYLLSRVASIVNPSMLVLDTPPTGATIPFMRATVVATDPVLIYGAYSLILALRAQNRTGKNASPTRCCADTEPDLHSAALIFFAPGLFLVDNMHFQYNGLPLGVLLLSLSLFVRRRCAAGVATYAVAVNLKHTLLPLAPALAMYTLSTLYRRAHSPTLSLQSFFSSIVTVGFVFFASLLLPWVPIAFVGGIPGVLSVVKRMFPFGRGLLHAYWAPNFWACYAAVDKVLVAGGLAVREADGDPASGHIGAMRPFRALPNVTPANCMQLIMAALVPVLAQTLLRRGSGGSGRVATLAAYSALAAFAFGWHVHEKNVLMALVPLAGTMGPSRRWELWMSFALLAMGGQFGVFPLMTGPAETAVKCVHFALYSVYVIALARKLLPKVAQAAVWAYLSGCCVVEVYGGAGGLHGRIFGRGRLQFVPLLVVSVYSAVGVLCGLSGLLVAFWRDEEDETWHGGRGENDGAA